MLAGLFSRVTGWCMIAAITPCAASAAAPTLTGFQILTPTVHINSQLASPAFKLNLTGNPTTVSFLYVGPSGESVTQVFQAPEGLGSVAVLQATLPYNFSDVNETMFSPYTEPGRWTIRSLSVCIGLNCSAYDKSTLSASTFNIANPFPPDIRPPALVSGEILTPTVSLASGLPIKIKLRVTDDVSGVQLAGACIAAPGGVASPGSPNSLCAVAPLPVHRTLDGTVIATVVPLAGTSPGIYPLQNLLLVDIAGNWSSLDTPASIAPYFPPGKASITITP